MPVTNPAASAFYLLPLLFRTTFAHLPLTNPAALPFTSYLTPATGKELL
jgi:hypothetical protein